MSTPPDKQQRSRFLIDDAPGKELIEELTVTTDPELLESFSMVRLT